MESKYMVALVGIVCLTAMELMAIYKGMNGQLLLAVGGIIGSIIGAVFGVTIKLKEKVNNYKKDTIK